MFVFRSRESHSLYSNTRAHHAYSIFLVVSPVGEFPKINAILPGLYIVYIPEPGTGLIDDRNPAKNGKQEIWKKNNSTNNNSHRQRMHESSRPVQSSLIQYPTACYVTDFELSPSSPVQYPTVCFVTDISYMTTHTTIKKDRSFQSFCPANKTPTFYYCLCYTL